MGTTPRGSCRSHSRLGPALLLDDGVTAEWLVKSLAHWIGSNRRTTNVDFHQARLLQHGCGAGGGVRSAWADPAEEVEKTDTFASFPRECEDILKP